MTGQPVGATGLPQPPMPPAAEGQRAGGRSAAELNMSNGPKVITPESVKKPPKPVVVTPPSVEKPPKPVIEPAEKPPPASEPPW